MILNFNKQPIIDLHFKQVSNQLYLDQCVLNAI